MHEKLCASQVSTSRPESNRSYLSFLKPGDARTKK